MQSEKTRFWGVLPALEDRESAIWTPFSLEKEAKSFISYRITVSVSKILLFLIGDGSFVHLVPTQIYAAGENKVTWSLTTTQPQTKQGGETEKYHGRRRKKEGKMSRRFKVRRRTKTRRRLWWAGQSLFSSTAGEVWETILFLFYF